jgi:hypothetical protein
MADTKAFGRFAHSAQAESGFKGFERYERRMLCFSIAAVFLRCVVRS